MDTAQALKLLDVGDSPSQDEIKVAYRRLALELHPDRNGGGDGEFKRITEAYNHLRKNGPMERPKPAAKKGRPARAQWGAPGGHEPPEQDWSKYTREFEQDADFWKEYEKKFWEDYNARVRADGRNGEYEKAKEPSEQPDLGVRVDESLCIGCCSCEIMAPEVFHIDRTTQSNPKSSVIDRGGAGVNKILNAARTCPTKAIIVDDAGTGERLFPY